MKLFKKSLCVLIGFCIIASLAICFNGCKEEDVQVLINAPQSLTVEEGSKIELDYSVTPFNCLVSFKRNSDNVFEYEKVDDGCYIKGISVGTAQLKLSAVYKQQTASTTVDIIVVAKENPKDETDPGDVEQPPKDEDNDSEKDPDDGDLDEPDDSSENPPDVGEDDKPDEDGETILDAENRIVIEYADLNDGYATEDKIYVRSTINFLVLSLGENISKAKFQVYTKLGEELTELLPTGMCTYALKDLGENYFLVVRLLDLDTNLTYEKLFEIIFEI